MISSRPDRKTSCCWTTTCLALMESLQPNVGHLLADGDDLRTAFESGLPERAFQSEANLLQLQLSRHDLSFHGAPRHVEELRPRRRLGCLHLWFRHALERGLCAMDDAAPPSIDPVLSGIL